MGWDSMNSHGAPVEQLLKEQLEWENLKVLKMVVDQPAFDGEKVAYVLGDLFAEGDWKKVAIIALYKLSPGAQYDFSVKIMDASMGPCYYDFPVAWLAELGPSSGPYEDKWRVTVEAHSKNYQLSASPAMVQGALL